MNQEVPADTLESFWDESHDFLSFPRLMAKFPKMDHVQNIETLCQRLAILSDCYLYKRTYNDRENKNTKDLILVLNIGASFGMIPFWIDFIDYVEADIPAKGVTKINWVIGIGIRLHKL